MSPEYKAALIARLRQLQHGDTPRSYIIGICYDLNRLHGRFGEKPCPYYLVPELSTAMGLDPDEPIPRRSPRPWEGEEGRVRRMFAGMLADELEGKPACLERLLTIRRAFMERV